MEYDIEVTVNEIAYHARIDAGTTLVQLLRDKLALTGTKEGCGIGECGACCVLLEGVLVNSCLVLAVEANGKHISTIEGEAKGDELSDLQKAFVDHHALQCGFSIPGMVMSARDLLNRHKTPTDEQIIEAISGNLCRCTGYETIIDAIHHVVRDNQQGCAQ